MAWLKARANALACASSRAAVPTSEVVAVTAEHRDGSTEDGNHPLRLGNDAGSVGLDGPPSEFGGVSINRAGGRGRVDSGRSRNQEKLSGVHVVVGTAACQATSSP
jgi:hypothetical protein